LHDKMGNKFGTKTALSVQNVRLRPQADKIWNIAHTFAPDGENCLHRFLLRTF